MPNPWTLVFKVTGSDPRRVVGGVKLALRLCLDAQRHGAAAYSVMGPSDAVREALSDPRVTLSHVDVPAPEHVIVEIPDNCLMHRQSFGLLPIERAASGTRLTRDDLPSTNDVAFWFSPMLVTDAASAAKAER